MIRLRLAIYSEAMVRVFQNERTKRGSSRVSLRAIRDYLAAGNDIDLENCNMTDIALYPNDPTPLRPGQYVSTSDLKAAGVTDILVRWDRDRKVNQLRLR